jgi:phosphoglucosamine mutase
MEALFGTDGIRGEAGRFPLDAATVNVIGSSLARYLANATGRHPALIIGRDTRESGQWLERALIEGAVSGGAECRSAGVITTPGVAFLTRSLQADAGIVISASHNPYHDNGIKIFSPSGRKLDDSIERQIESDILTSAKKRQSPQPHEPPTDLTPGDEESLQRRYLTFLSDEIGKGLSLKGLTIVLDCANGASSALAPVLFERLGARPIPINYQPDGRNINKDCGSLHIEGLRQRVVAEKADLGVAFDGDADRALFIDKDGNFVDGDATLWVLANYLHAKSQLKQDLVVATVMSNIGLEIALRSRGLRLVRTDVGDKYVLEELLRLGASLGGEQSGHIIFPQLSLAGDGMISALCLLRAMREQEKTLFELSAGFERYPQVLINVPVREKRAFGELPEVQQVVAETEQKLSDKGRLLLRYSGTEPLARIMIEGQKQSEIEAYARDIASVIRHTLGN